jgi:hypothetical protein
MKYHRLISPITIGSLLLVGCSSDKDQLVEVAIIEQYSRYMSEWQDVALFYGYGNNAEIAEKYMKAFEPSSERPLRLRITTQTKGNLERISRNQK